jgi:3-deoxy-7-phosphoheptulonate synthase
MIDASHGNSERDHARQRDVVRDLASQIAEGSRGIVGVMVESNLVAGRQDLRDAAALVYGQSITDACIGWDDTAVLLDELASAVRARRSRNQPRGDRVVSTSR